MADVYDGSRIQTVGRELRLTLNGMYGTIKSGNQKKNARSSNALLDCRMVYMDMAGQGCQYAVYPDILNQGK